jgi:hypothetical protein
MKQPTPPRFQRTRRPAGADDSTVLINFRVSEERREAYQRAAADEELTLSDWIRGLCDEELRRRKSR